MMRFRNLYLSLISIILCAFLWYMSVDKKREDYLDTLMDLEEHVEALKNDKISQEKAIKNKSSGNIRGKGFEDSGDKVNNYEKKPKKKVFHISETEWSKSLMKKGKKYFSQNDEDGVIEAVFDYVGTTDKVYVEFGVENGKECNTRYLREKKGWDTKGSLLMDGGHENPDINLKKVIFWPDNIIALFEKFGVKKEFDFLSLDVDSYDWFMLEAILEAGYSPRVIICEYNSNFEIEDAKSIMPPSDGKSWERWDNSTYQGMSLLAATYLLNRFSYSVVWCNSINCIAVRDSELDAPMRRPVEDFKTARLDVHMCDNPLRKLAVIDKKGRWAGSDNRKGSPHIRCPWHNQKILD